MTQKKRPSPTLAMRLDDVDKSDLRELSLLLNRSQVDTVRVLVREARHILPELKARANAHPLPHAGRPRGVHYTLATMPKTAQVKR